MLGPEAHRLARVRRDLVFEPLEVLPDGPYRAKRYPSPQARRHDKGGIEVRLIEYTLGDPARAKPGEVHRLTFPLPSAARAVGAAG